MNINVIKVGGAIVENPTTLSALLDEFVKIEGPKVLVHGGGRTATQLATKLGIESHMVGGRRITDGEMLRVVTMVYAGLVNKGIVAKLQARGINAIGLCGADMNIVSAHRRPVTPEGIDFGYVGDVDSADGLALSHLLDAGYTPVIAPLTHDSHGNLLNINADTMAQTVAVALAQTQLHATQTLAAEEQLNPNHTDLNSASTMAYCSQAQSARPVTLTFCFELPGVMRDPDDPNSLIPHITPELFSQLTANGIVSGGMVPKLQNAFAAISDGVAQVRITAHTALNAGTTIAIK